MAARRAARVGIGTKYNALRWLSRTAVRWGPRFTSTGPVQEPPPLASLVSRLGLGRAGAHHSRAIRLND
jgi:hypothetical protein